MSGLPLDRRAVSLQSSHLKMHDNTTHEHMQHTLPESSRSPNPTSALLQDLLCEKKAQTQRAPRTYDLNGRHANGKGHDLDNRAVQSSPLVPVAARERLSTNGRQGSASGGKDASATKEMGVREMEQVSSLRSDSLRTLLTV